MKTLRERRFTFIGVYRRGPGLPNPSRETNFSGVNADREIFIFPVQLTTCRTGNLTRLIHTLAICVTIHIIVTIAISCQMGANSRLASKDVNHRLAVRSFCFLYYISNSSEKPNILVIY